MPKHADRDGIAVPGPGESVSYLNSVSARQGHVLRLLDAAAAQVKEAGRRLLIVVDGLDEDFTAAGRSSIAALLPRRPPSEVLVLVASRQHPGLPDDVPGDHPLRLVEPRPLQMSQHARDIELKARMEMARALAGGSLQREVLGFITASGGGLTLTDLEQLTGRPPWELNELLDGPFGRTVGSRLRGPDVMADDGRVYLLTHETLRVIAERQFGGILSHYRERIHAWNDTFRQRGWPANTPSYLLRGYTRMLAHEGDRDRLIACATDFARHDRMFSLTGGDAVSLTEIGMTQQLLLAESEPDLVSLVRICVHREHLAERNSHIPIKLPAVWARLGQRVRSEALANSITDATWRVDALTHLIEAAVELGESAWARRLAHRTADMTARVGRPFIRTARLVKLIAPLAAAGDLTRANYLTDQAEHDAKQITEPHRQVVALAELAEAVARIGDRRRAYQFIDTAEQVAKQIGEVTSLLGPFSRMIKTARTLGDQARIEQFAHDAEAHFRKVCGQRLWIPAVQQLVSVLAEVGEFRRAEVLSTLSGLPELQVVILAGLAKARAIGKERSAAQRLINLAEGAAQQISDPDERAVRLAQVAEAAALTGDHRRTYRLADVAGNAARHIGDRNAQSAAMHWTVKAIASLGELQHAERLSALIDDPQVRGQSLGAIAKLAGTTGDYLYLDTIVERTNPLLAADDLTELAETVLAAGNRRLAEQLASKAEIAARQIQYSGARGYEYESLIEALAKSGQHLVAEELIARIPSPAPRTHALTSLVRIVAAAGDHHRAEQLAQPSRDCCSRNCRRTSSRSSPCHVGQRGSARRQFTAH